MIIPFALLLFSTLTFFVIRAPGAALIYLVLFQTFNKLVCDELGIGAFRQWILLALLGSLFLLHNRSTGLRENLVSLFRSPIARAYGLLTLYIILYALYLGTSYEYQYIREFIMPGMVLLVLAGLLFFRDEMYFQAVVGVVVFSMFTFVALNIFRDFGTISTLDRQDISAAVGIGPLTQGKLGGVMALGSILLYLRTKSTWRWLTIIPLLTSSYWLINLGSRGAVLFLIAALVGHLLLARNSLRATTSLAIFLVVLVPVALVSGVADNFGSSVLAERSTELIAEGGVESTARYDRILLFRTLLPDLSPFGIGPGGWGRDIMEGDFRYPHNIIIESIIEFGVVGLVFVTVLFVSGVKVIRGVSAASDLRARGMSILTVFWLYFAFNTLTSGSFLTNTEFHAFSGIMISLTARLQSASWQTTHRFAA